MVRGLIPEIQSNAAFESVACPLCKRDHLVNRVTRKVFDMVARIEDSRTAIEAAEALQDKQPIEV
jgi:hypothetical protein